MQAIVPCKMKLTLCRTRR